MTLTNTTALNQPEVRPGQQRQRMNDKRRRKGSWWKKERRPVDVQDTSQAAVVTTGVVGRSYIASAAGVMAGLRPTYIHAYLPLVVSSMQGREPKWRAVGASEIGIVSLPRRLVV